MELRIWVDESDLEQLESEQGLSEQDVLDTLSEAITEWAGKEYGIVLNAETAE